MPLFNIMNREVLNGMRLSTLNFNRVCKYLDDSLDGDWNEKVPNRPIPFKAFCRTNYANKHMIETCIMVEGDINETDILTGVVLRFYFRNKIVYTDLSGNVSQQNKQTGMEFSIVDPNRNLQYNGGDDKRLNLIIKEYKRLVNPLEIRTLKGKIEIIGYDLYNHLNPYYNDRTALEMMHKIYELEQEYLEIFDNL